MDEQFELDVPEGVFANLKVIHSKKPRTAPVLGPYKELLGTWRRRMGRRAADRSADG